MPCYRRKSRSPRGIVATAERDITRWRKALQHGYRVSVDFAETLAVELTILGLLAIARGADVSAAVAALTR